MKDCKFFLFEGKSFPVPPVVNAEYANGMGCGYGIYALSHTDELLVLDKKRVMEMYDGNAKVKATVCVDFDTQILTELKKYYEDKSKCPEAFCNLLADLEMYKCDYTCLPYIFENGSKLNDARIRKGMCECLKVYFHYKENSLHDFGLGLPFSNETYLNTKRMLDDMQNYTHIGSYDTMQKTIYCMLLKCASISLKNELSDVGKKFSLLLDFVNYQLGYYLERELILCYLHFKRNTSVSRFFKRIQYGAKNIIQAVRGMAWDLWHLRMLELWTAMDADNDEQFSIHAMLTHDFGLQDVLKSVPLQRLAIVQNTNGLLPTTIPKYKLQLSDIIVDNIDIERNFVENKTIRKQTQNQVDFDKLIGKLEDELSMYMK